MSVRLALTRMLAGPEEWSRRRLQVLVAIAAIVITAIVGGAVWSVIELLGVGSGSTPSRSGGHSSTRGLDRQPASIDEAQPGLLSTHGSGTIRIPQPASVGAAQVGTGFPRSVPGALAQLIAIDRRAIESGSVVTAQDVITAWAAPGGPTPQTWSGVVAVQTLLASAGLPANGSTDFSIQLEPAMGLVEDHTPTVCVDFVLTAAVRGGAPDRIAVADCQRMVWLDGHWVVASGHEAPSTPSLWPGTKASYDAGYKWLEVEP
jgi:hypothetical protein